MLKIPSTAISHIGLNSPGASKYRHTRRSRHRYMGSISSPLRLEAIRFMRETNFAAFGDIVMTTAGAAKGMQRAKIKAANMIKTRHGFRAMEALAHMTTSSNFVRARDNSLLGGHTSPKNSTRLLARSLIPTYFKVFSESGG